MLQMWERQLRDQLTEVEIGCIVATGLYDMTYMPVIQMNRGLVTALSER